MEELSTSKKFTNYLLENYEFTESRRGKLVMDGDFTLSGNGVATKFFNRFIKNNKEPYQESLGSLVFKDEGTIKDELSGILSVAIDTIQGHLHSQKIKEALGGDDKGLAEVESYMTAVPVVDMQSSKGEARMARKGDFKPLDFSEKAWVRVVGAKHAALMSEVVYAGYFEYNPDSEKYIRTVNRDGMELNYFNRYITPEIKSNPNRDIKVDPLFIKFFDTFFLGESRQYAIDWIYNSLFYKMEAYMVLVGAGGTGKNFLAEALKMLHGQSNFNKAPASALDSKFNGHLNECTLVYYDECKFNPQGSSNAVKNRLKEWSNSYVSVEVKGVDSVDKDIYCSGLISSNNDSDIYIEQLDRKFSVMEITDERLEKRLGVEDAKKLWAYLNNPDMVHGVMNWLEENHDPDFDRFKEYRGPKFEQLVISSLSNWQQQLLELIKSKESAKYYLSSLQETIPFFPKNRAKVTDFLRTFKHEDNLLGGIYMDQNQAVIKCTDYFSPDKSANDLDKDFE